MAKRSNKQSEIYDFIREQIRIKGYPPSVREICTAVGLKSTSTVHAHLAKLEQMGYIKRDSTKPRAIELLKDSIINKEMIDIPIVGKVAAGKPILAVENIEEYFSLPINFVKNDKDLFILKVKGDSMVDAGILDGDFAIIEKDNSANNGNIIVALIDGEATIKRFFKKEDHIILQPENKYMNPIIVKECSIVGKLVGIYRKY